MNNKTLVLIICTLNLPSFIVGCCRSKPKEYALVSTTDFESHSIDVNNLSSLEQTYYIKKAPKTRGQKAWLCCKFIGSGILMAGIDVGSAFLALNILQEENTVNNDLSDIKGDLDTGVNDIHEIYNITSLIEHYSSTCSGPTVKLEEAFLNFILNCNVTGG